MFGTWLDCNISKLPRRGKLQRDKLLSVHAHLFWSQMERRAQKENWQIDKLFGKYCSSQARPNHAGGRSQYGVFPFLFKSSSPPIHSAGRFVWVRPAISSIQGNISSTSVSSLFHSYSPVKEGVSLRFKGGTGGDPEWDGIQRCSCPTSPHPQPGITEDEL